MVNLARLRKLKSPNLSRKSVVTWVLVLLVVVVAAPIGRYMYHRLTTITVTAYFSATPGLYQGNNVQVQGVKVGSIDSITPQGDRMKVVFHYQSKYGVPADAQASILNPTLVASRVIQLSPPYAGGPQLRDGATIPLERTQVPVEYDDLRNSLTRILTGLGPTPQQPKGPFGDVIESFADGLAGKGEQLNKTFTSLSDALNGLNEGRGDLFSIIKNLALFVNALYKNDQQFMSLNNELAQFTDSFTNTDRELTTAIKDLDTLLTNTRKFFTQSGPLLTRNIDNLNDITTAILQPEPRQGLERTLHVLPNFASNFANIYQPTHGAITAIPVINNFANPLQLICSAIQAGSRLGYQESAELCAQYLAPILDSIKFNYLPLGGVPFSTAMTLPKDVAYSEPRLQPPPGYKDTTVPGIWARDTLFSHGNHEPGWTAAPGMQGLDVQALTANMLTPDSLAALLGGPDPAPPAPGIPGGAPPNAYDETNPLPPPWYPQPGPPPFPTPGVVPGAPAPATAVPPLPAEQAGTP